MKKSKYNRICTFNCQGLLNKTKQQLIADDFIAYNLTIMAIQETNMKNHGVCKIKSTSGKELYLYYSGQEEQSKYGVGFIVDPKCILKFIPVSDRICMITTKISNKHQVNIISAYAPTLETTKNSPDITANFYEELESVIKLTNSRDTLIIGGDFNAKTKIDNKMENRLIYETFNRNIGKYAHSDIN